RYQEKTAKEELTQHEKLLEAKEERLKEAIDKEWLNEAEETSQSEAKEKRLIEAIVEERLNGTTKEATQGLIFVNPKVVSSGHTQESQEPQQQSQQSQQQQLLPQQPQQLPQQDEQKRQQVQQQSEQPKQQRRKPTKRSMRQVNDDEITQEAGRTSKRARVTFFFFAFLKRKACTELMTIFFFFFVIWIGIDDE
ncbi:hypothetical protein RFI_34262, partial [Reticulomyxa filosa]